MHVRIKYKSAAEAERAAEKLPVGCSWKIVKDRTTDAYLEVPEEYEDYVMRYLPPETKRTMAGRCLMYDV